MSIACFCVHLIIRNCKSGTIEHRSLLGINFIRREVGTSLVLFFHPREKVGRKTLPHSFAEPSFESRRPDAAKLRLALGVGTQSRQDPTESRAADQG